MSNKILFVNKSANSKRLTRSEGAERSKIFSHVQQLPHQAVGDKFRVTGWDVSTAVDYDPSKTREVSSGDEVDKTGSRLRRKSRNTQAKFDYEQRCAAIIRLRDSPPMDIDASKLDPFDCSAIRLDAYMTDLLKAYCTSMLEQVCEVRAWGELNLHYHLKYASESAELLYAMLCTSCAVIFAKSNDTKHVYYAMQFKGQALHNLYRSIEQVKDGKTPSIATVFAIGFHVYLECVQGEMKAAKSHYIALRECMSSIGPTANIPLPMRVGMMVPSLVVSSMLEERPIVLPIFEQEDEHSTDIFLDELLISESHRSTIEQLSGAGFSDSPSQRLLGQRLSGIISDIRQIQQIRGSQAERERPPSRNELRKLFTSSKDVEYKILSMPYEPVPLTPEQDAVRLALYLVCKPTVLNTPMTPMFNQSMAVKIRTALERTSLTTWWSPCSTLLMWVLVVAASVSPDGEQRAWIVRQAVVLKRELRIHSQEEMGHSLSEFFYPRDHFAETLTSLWVDMEVLERGHDSE